jgi:integrase
MGWVKIRAGGDGRASYTAMYRDLSGRERSAGTFTRERQAISAWHRAEAAMRTGTAGDPALGRQTLRRYVEETWFPNHLIEATTRENYRCVLDLHILPDLGDRRMNELMPAHVREWVTGLGERGVRPPTVKKAKQVLDAILTTAMNDRVTALHAGRGVRTPPVSPRPRQIVTVEQYERVRAAIGDPTMRLLVDTGIETGLRWGELTELRPRDLDVATGVVTVARAVVHLKAKRQDGAQFLVKDYPKDREARRVKLAPHLVVELVAHIADRGLDRDDLIFAMPAPATGRRERPYGEQPAPLRASQSHGSLTAYNDAGCRCRPCRDAVANYRATRRTEGRDQPRRPRGVAGDGHIPNPWFRSQVWNPAVRAADIGVHVTPHGLRHAHASWLLAGGADLQTVKERLGHGSITTTGQYLHTLPGAGDAALAALDAYRGRVPAQESPVPPADSRDAELAELREAVDQLSRMLTRLSLGEQVQHD